MWFNLIYCLAIDSTIGMQYSNQGYHISYSSPGYKNAIISKEDRMS